MRRVLVGILCLAALAIAAPAPAQLVRSAPPEPFNISTRVFFAWDQLMMDAGQTFDAVVGSDRLFGPGGGVDLTARGTGPFFRAAVSWFKEEGTRVFIVNDEPVSLDIPLEVEMFPVELGGGWRQSVAPERRVEVYCGASAIFLKYRETSDFASDDENSDEWFPGYAAFGGVDVDLWKGMMAGVEAQYRRVPDAIGEAGVSGVFDETDLGGFVIRLVFGVRR